MGPEVGPVQVTTKPLTKDLSISGAKPYLQVNHAHYKKLQRLFIRSAREIVPNPLTINTKETSLSPRCS